MQLTNKVVIITGSSSGIGEATAYLFAKEGARVVINADKNEEGCARVVETIHKNGGEAVYFLGDLSDPEAAKMLMEKTIETYGSIDILINNAGGYESQDFLTASKESWLHIFDVNLFTTICCSQAVAPYMIRQGYGKILNTSSVYGFDYTGDPTGMAYSVAKAAINSLTKNLAKLWAPTILVNAVAPGYVYLPRFDTFSQSVQKEMQGQMGIERWIEPSEIAEAFLYLAKSDAVTGEIHQIDGGFGLK